MRTTESGLFTFINIWNREELHILEKNLFCFLMIPDIQEEKSITKWSDTYLVAQLYSLYTHQTTRQVGLSGERNYLSWITGTSQSSNHFQPKKKKTSFIVSTQRYPFFFKTYWRLEGLQSNKSSVKYSSVWILCSPLSSPTTMQTTLLWPVRLPTSMPIHPWDVNFLRARLHMSYSVWLKNGTSQMSEYTNEIDYNLYVTENGYKK